MTPLIALVSNTAWSVFNFRRNLLALLERDGRRVLVSAGTDAYSSEVAAKYEFVPLAALSSHGTNPMQDVRLFFELLTLFRRVRPVVVLTFTIKPNIYGSLAARLLGIPAICTVNGLGRATRSPGRVGAITRALYRRTIRYAARVVFQNAEDREWMVARRIVAKERTALTPGSGVDLLRFAEHFESKAAGEARFLFCGRILRSKGAELFSRAARILKAEFPSSVFELLGQAGNGDADSVTIAELHAWETDGAVRYLGESRDVRPYMAAAHVVVLPSSYPEGVPRALIEALASGKPIVTTDAPGCRDTVDAGANGFLVTPDSLEDLIDALRRLILFGADEYRAMCVNSRRKAEQEFDERLVLARYAEILEAAV